MFANIAKISDKILIPTIFVLSVVGSYAINNNAQDILVMFVFGVIGYFATKFDLNPASIVLALILGPIGESGLRRTLILSHGNISTLFSGTISWVLIGLTLFSMFSPIIMSKIQKRQSQI